MSKDHLSSLVLPPNWSEHDVHDSLKQPMGLHDTLVGPLNHVLNQVFTRTSCKVLRVRDVPGPSDESGAPTVLASVTGPMNLSTMRQLLEEEALGGANAADNDVATFAFVDWAVPDRLLYSPVVSRNLAQPLAWHLAAARRGVTQVWTLPDIMRVSTPAEINEAEAFAREHYGPAPPPGQAPLRTARRQRRGCRGGKGRKRHMLPHEDASHSYSPRIMSTPAPLPWAPPAMGGVCAGASGLWQASVAAAYGQGPALFRPPLSQ